MAARRPFWKWHRWKSIGFCLWPPSTCIWNLKLKFQSKLDLCSGNHVVYRQTDRRTDKVNPIYPPSNFVGRGYNDTLFLKIVKKNWAIYCDFPVGSLPQRFAILPDVEIFTFDPPPMLPKNFYGSSDICAMGFIYPIQIFEISHQTFGPSHRKCPTCLFFFQYQLPVPTYYVETG